MRKRNRKRRMGKGKKEETERVRAGGRRERPVRDERKRKMKK